jgi:hypothetical protein
MLALRISLAQNTPRGIRSANVYVARVCSRIAVTTVSRAQRPYSSP